MLHTPLFLPNFPQSPLLNVSSKCGRISLTTYLTTTAKSSAEYPGLAKFGIAPGLGPGDRGFKSRSPDQKCYKSLLRFIAFFVCREDCKDVIDRNCSIVFTSANNTSTSCCRTFIINSLFDNWQHFLPYTFITISLVNYYISSHCQFRPFLL